MFQNVSKCCKMLHHDCNLGGPKMIQIWPKSDPNRIQIWSTNISKMLKQWSKNDPNLDQTRWTQCSNDDPQLVNKCSGLGPELVQLRSSIGSYLVMCLAWIVCQERMISTTSKGFLRRHTVGAPSRESPKTKTSNELVDTTCCFRYRRYND